MHDYWIPAFKWQLLEWFKQKYPGWKVSKWNKKKLYAVYNKIRIKENV